MLLQVDDGVGGDFGRSGDHFGHAEVHLLQSPQTLSLRFLDARVACLSLVSCLLLWGSRVF